MLDSMPIAQDTHDWRPSPRGPWLGCTSMSAAVDIANTAEMWGGRPREKYTVICLRSGQHYLKSDGPTSFTGPYRPVKEKMYWPNWSGGLKSAPGKRASAYVEGWRFLPPSQMKLKYLMPHA